MALDRFGENEYILGTPSHLDSRSLWKASEADSDVSDEEFFVSVSDLEKRVGQRCQLVDVDVPQDKWECYVRGDFFGDRTLYLYFYIPERITSELLNDLQEWLNRSSRQNWRIFIPGELEDETYGLMIYPRIVRYGDEKVALSPYVQRMVKEMRASIQGEKLLEESEGE